MIYNFLSPLLICCVILIFSVFSLFAELEHRLDFQLKEGKMENSYIAALTSHTSYWTNMDVALFILSQIFPDSAPS